MELARCDRIGMAYCRLAEIELLQTSVIEVPGLHGSLQC